MSFLIEWFVDGIRSSLTGIKNLKEKTTIELLKQYLYYFGIKWFFETLIYLGLLVLAIIIMNAGLGLIFGVSLLDGNIDFDQIEKIVSTLPQIPLIFFIFITFLIVTALVLYIQSTLKNVAIKAFLDNLKEGKKYKSNAIFASFKEFSAALKSQKTINIFKAIFLYSLLVVAAIILIIFMFTFFGFNILPFLVSLILIIALWIFGNAVDVSILEFMKNEKEIFSIIKRASYVFKNNIIELFSYFLGVGIVIGVFYLIILIITELIYTIISVPLSLISGIIPILLLIALPLLVLVRVLMMIVTSAITYYPYLWTLHNFLLKSNEQTKQG